MDKNAPEKSPFEGIPAAGPSQMKAVPAAPVPQTHADDSEDSMLRIIMLLLTVSLLGAALLSGAYVAFNVVLLKNHHTMTNLFPILVVVTLVYLIGWLVGLVSVRLYHIPYVADVIQTYAIGTLAGIIGLYSIIMVKLYLQDYTGFSFFKYIMVIATLFGALLGFHLLPEKHSLKIFAVFLLPFNLGNLSLIVYRYVFTRTANYALLGYDIFFFLFMTAISISMLIHIGMLNWVRRAIERIFEKKPEKIADTKA